MDVWRSPFVGLVTVASTLLRTRVTIPWHLLHLQRYLVYQDTLTFLWGGSLPEEGRHVQNLYLEYA